MKYESLYNLGDKVKFYIFDEKILFQGIIVAVHFFLDKSQETYDIQMSNKHKHTNVSIDKIIGKTQ